ncbi:MAG: maleylpyruvate isomerase family mycothiol-dependent enzyme [Nocardioidaceae bacterium]
MATENDLRRAVAAERSDLADLLDGLDQRSWDEPTLCEGWRVREVVAHLTMPFRYSTPRFVVEMIKARGSFNRMADTSARHDARDLTAAQLTASLRDNVNHPWKPPGGGYEGALSHDVIHGLDITTALGTARKVPGDRLGIVLGSIKPRQVKFFGVDLDGIELRADDLDWTYGSGTALTGAAQDLLLVLCGRILPEGHLHGEASGRFTAT